MTKRGAKLYEKDKYKNINKALRKGVYVENEWGIANGITDLSGNRIPYSDLVAYESHYSKRINKGASAIMGALGVIGMTAAIAYTATNIDYTSFIR